MTDISAPRGAPASGHDADFTLGKAAQAGALMDAAYLENDPAPASGRAVLQIQQQDAVWHVTLDGHLLGDYRRMEHAMDAVETKARALRTAGRGVAIVTLSSSGAVLVSTMLEAA